MLMRLSLHANFVLSAAMHQSGDFVSLNYLIRLIVQLQFYYVIMLIISNLPILTLFMLVLTVLLPIIIALFSVEVLFVEYLNWIDSSQPPSVELFFE